MTSQLVIFRAFFFRPHYLKSEKRSCKSTNEKILALSFDCLIFSCSCKNLMPYSQGEINVSIINVSIGTFFFKKAIKISFLNLKIIAFMKSKVSDLSILIFHC